MTHEERLKELYNAEWRVIIGTGQSLSCGFSARLGNDTDPAPGAFILTDTSGSYDLSNPDSDSLKMASLIEPLRARGAGSDKYPNNIEGMTPHHALSRTLSKCLGKKEVLKGEGERSVIVHTCAGQGGAPMALIKKNGDSNSYAASIFEARAFSRLAKEYNARLSFDAVILTHGESDAVLCNENYGLEVLQMQRDYAEDLMSISGQEKEPILILSQQNTCPPVRDFLPTVTDQMWRVQDESDSKVICAGPKYQYKYADGLHLPPGGYNRLGEKYGQVIFQVIDRGLPFKPLSPYQAKELNASKIAVYFHVPVQPLRWDDVLPASNRSGEHSMFRHGRGFELRDDSGHKFAIRNVSIKSEDNAVLLDFTPGPERRPLTVAYAMSQSGEGFGPGGFGGGSEHGRMGHLSDSAESDLVDTVRCHVQTGSHALRSAKAWGTQAIYDQVNPGNLVIVGIDPSNAERAFLNEPWQGATGVRDMTVSHNQRNYCVAFTIPVER